MSSAADRFRHLFRYEQQSHEAVLGALEAAPAESRAAASFQKAIDMFAHIAAARRIWLWRLGVSDFRPDGVFPKNVTLEALRADLESMHAAWCNYFAKLDDAEVERVLDYTMLDGTPVRSSVDDILTQLHGHSLYHRGQISTWMREAGAQPAATDYIHWVRMNSAGA